MTDNTNAGQDATETWQDPDIALTADVVLFGEHNEQLYVLMVTRRWNPFVGRRALPGGMVEADEETITAARRELLEETGLLVGAMQYVGVYSAPHRDPRGRWVSFAYTTRLPRLQQPTAGDDAATAEWVLVDEALAFGTELAFDHERIIGDALRIAL